MNNRNILKRIYLPALTIALILCCVLSIIKAKTLGGTIKAIEDREELIARTVFISRASAEAMREKLRASGGSIKDNAAKEERKSLREAVKETQALLRKNFAASSGFRITGDTAEFIIRCSPEEFFAILAESSLNIIYLNVKPEKDDPPELSIIMRIRHET